MVAKIPSSGAGLSQRSGSSGGLVAYLEKEVQGEWFSLDRQDVPAAEVVTTLDANKRNLNRDADKYYQVILAPSQAELRHIDSDPEKLRAYTRRNGTVRFQFWERNRGAATSCTLPR